MSDDMSDELKAVPANELLEVCDRCFQACGMSEADAHLLADTLVTADLGGTHSHGVMRVREYVKKLCGGGVDPAGRPVIAKDSGACIVVDGNNSMGQIGAHFAMTEVIARAEQQGIAAAAIRGSNHCGVMGYYALQASRADMIGVATTNSLPTMAPWGGVERILGINPLGVAIPAQHAHPIVFDAAFSGSSHGKIRIHQQKGIPLPEGWALDAQGRPTTDPVAAIDGLLMPIGGFKGTALALVMGILSSMLSGSAYGTELGNMEDGPKSGEDGHFMAAIKISAFEEVDRFKERIDAAIDEIHNCRLAEGFDRTYAPGEKEFLNREAYERDGIPLNAETLSDIAAAADEVGVDVKGYDWLGSEIGK
jgi:LDH2 family malate/lactate/ureidoglycolate dehydrogenase